MNISWQEPTPPSTSLGSAQTQSSTFGTTTVTVAFDTVTGEVLGRVQLNPAGTFNAVLSTSSKEYISLEFAKSAIVTTLNPPAPPEDVPAE